MPIPLVCTLIVTAFSLGVVVMGVMAIGRVAEAELAIELAARRLYDVGTHANADPNPPTDEPMPRREPVRVYAVDETLN